MTAKVLLVNSPTMGGQAVADYAYPPQGLLSLATYLQANNIETILADIHVVSRSAGVFDEIMLMGYIQDSLLPLIARQKPDLLGIGAAFSGAFRSLRIIAREVKGRFPSLPIVIGGIHATIFAREILTKYGFIDYVILGEGEVTLMDLVRLVTGNAASGQALASLDGIAYRSGSNVRVVPRSRYTDDLDSLPLLDYGLVDLSQYAMDTSKWYSPKGIEIGLPFALVTSRSCPERCNFCSMKLVHGPRIRYRSAENVLDEMERLYNEYGARYFPFMDDNLTFSKPRILEICDGIRRRGLNIQFDAPNGVSVNRLDGEIICALVEAGMIRISLAIESGSSHMRNAVIGKNLSDEKIHRVVEECAKHCQLWIHAFFIVGFPEETEKTLEETFAMIRQLPLDKFSIFYATPYPGTRLFKYCADHGLLTCSTEDWVDSEDLQYLAEHPHFAPHALSRDDLVEFRAKCSSYLAAKRRDSPVPQNYPLRYRLHPQAGVAGAAAGISTAGRS